MNEEQLLGRIELNPNVMVGKPVIRGTRLTIDFILNLLAHGATENEVTGEYEGLTLEDIHACALHQNGPMVLNSKLEAGR